MYRAGLSAERERLRPYFLLTNKPVLAVVNVGEDELDRLPTLEALVAEELGGHAEVLGMSVQLEAEATLLDEADRAEMLEALGLGEGALTRLVRSAYHLLGLRTFLTTGDKESRAWTVRAGAKAPEAAGVIHSDLQRGFIRAEVIRWDDLLEIGSWSRPASSASSAWRARTTRSRTATRSRSASTFVASRCEAARDGEFDACQHLMRAVDNHARMTTSSSSQRASAT